MNYISEFGYKVIAFVVVAIVLLVVVTWLI